MNEQLNKLIKLKSISGGNDKKQFLLDNKDDILFIKMIEFLLDDFILTGISKKKLKKEVKIKSVPNIWSFIDYVSYIKEHDTGSDEDITELKSFLAHKRYTADLSNEQFDILMKLLIKDLKLGITAKTFNKVFPNNKIKTFNVMLAKKYEDHIDKVDGGKFTITQKFDGIRCVLIKENGKTKAYSRSGKPITGIEHITSELDFLLSDNIMLDGELLNDNDTISSDENFRETQSKALSKSGDKSNLIFYCFDGMPLNLFYNGGSPLIHSSRLKNVKKFISNLNNIKMVDILYQGDDTSKITEIMQYATNNGWEGIMISLDKPYVCKRTHYLLKVKKMHTCDLKIIGYQEGTGKFHGTLGALIVDYKGNELGVGSGFDDDARDNIWNNQSDYIGKIIEVQYFEESSDKDGKLSLRFPVFKGFRLDKDEESYN